MKRYILLDEYRNVCSILVNVFPNNRSLWELCRFYVKNISILFCMMFLKGAVSQDFSRPSGTLINKLKWFCLKICLCGDIRKKFDSAQAITAGSQKL